MEEEKNDCGDNGEKKPDNSNDLNNFDDDDVDLVDAYYKQRLSKSSSNSIFKAIESDSDSSLGVLDMDNISVLDEMENQFMTHDRFSFLTKNNLTGRSQDLNVEVEASDVLNNPYISKIEPSRSELNLIKQRELAKKTLLQLNDKLELINKNLNSLDIDKVKQKQGVRETEKKSFVNELFSRGNKINWLDKHQSPQTPKFFKDELNSITESSHTPVVWMKDFKSKSGHPQGDICPAASTVSGDEIISKDGNFSASSLTFESQNPADILNRFEDDEKRFIKEQSALPNNSKISQFSGIAGDELIHLETKELSEHERISIGKYFELRSHSINSLIGEKGPQDSEPIREVPEPTGFNTEETTSHTLVRPVIQLAQNNEMNEARIEEELETNKIKRWNSCDFNTLPETAIERQSNESSGSTSTLIIQNLLCRMDSGLSGTEINDRLLECLGKIKNENKEKAGSIGAAENVETPKSSRTLAKSRNFRNHKSERNVSVTDLERKYTKNSLEGKRSISKSCSEMRSDDFKDNARKVCQNRSRPHKTALSLRNEFVTKNSIKGFESSTPKFEYLRSNAEKFKSDCNKLRISDKDWEPPRVSSLRRSINLSESSSAGESEKTVIVDCTVTSSGNNKNTNNDTRNTFTIEDTITEGDLTIVSERLSKMQEESVCVVRLSPRRQDDIVTVVHELAKYPKRSVDCSALTPVLREQYPELLSTFSFKADETKAGTYLREPNQKITEPTTTSPGSWVIFLFNSVNAKNIVGAVEHLKKLILKPVRNQTKDWLIISLESISVEYQTEKFLNGTKISNGFHVEDLLFVSMKDTLVPPDEVCSLKICIIPRVPVTVNVKLVLNTKKLTSKESRTEEMLICVESGFLQDISIIPTHGIDFGLIPEECCEKKTLQVCFDGTCELPIRIFTDKPKNFVLNPGVLVNGEKVKECIWKDNEFFYTFEQGSRRILEVEVLFKPGQTLKSTKNAQVCLNGTLSVVLDAPEKNVLIRKVPLCGRVGFAKFLCNPSCSPFILRTVEIGKSVKRSFPLKNVGAIGVEFSLSVVCENSHDEVKDDLFIVPKTFFLPKDEEKDFDIIFSGKTKENYVRRYLLFQMKPNGQIFYDIELIGVVMPAPGGKSVSSSSNRSGPTQSICNGNIAFKLMSTTQSLSWAAVPLDVELKQTFHIMNSSTSNAVARFAFRKERSAFRFMNENGELIEKLKKVLKPNCSNVMTVVFRPDVSGPHNNSIIIETNHLTGRKMISVNGYGGCPKIFIRNLKSDLNGSKIIRLVSSECESQNFRATIEFVNKGNVSGFVSVKTIAKVLSLSSGLEVEPSNFVLLPNSTVSVQIGHVLKNDDIKRLLSGRDIGKLATVIVTTGDEPSRFRLRKLIKQQNIKTSEPITFLMSEFDGEIDQDIGKLDDDKHFESIFRKNLETTEIAVIIERPMEVFESTIFEDFEETVKEFVTILPAADYSLRSFRGIEQSNRISSKEFNLEKSNLSASSGESSNSHDKKIKKWLATIERP